MFGNESKDVAGGKDFFDSCGLFAQYQATDHHISPHSLHALVMRPSNPPRNVALFKNLESVAIATQFLEAPGGRSKWKSTREDLKTRKERVRQALRHDNGAERNCGWGLGLCRIEWMSRLSFDVPAVISRWKQKNARRRRVLWIFATCVPGA